MTLKYQLLLLLLAALSRVGWQEILRLACEQEVCPEDTRQVGCLPLSKSKVSSQLYC